MVGGGGVRQRSPSEPAGLALAAPVPRLEWVSAAGPVSDGGKN